MNKLALFLVAMMILPTAVLAVEGRPSGGGGGSGGGGPGDEGYSTDMDALCQEIGLHYGVAQFRLSEDEFELTSGSGATIAKTVEGVAWTSETPIKGVYAGEVNDADEKFFHIRKFSPARLSDSFESSNQIQVLTLCAESDQEVPEFSTVALIGVSAICVAALAFKKN